MTIAEANAAQSAFYATHDRTEDAGPAWDDLTPAERDEHRQTCPDLCALCDENRAWGECASCGDTAEAMDDGYGCCGSIIVMLAPVEDNRLAAAA